MNKVVKTFMVGLLTLSLGEVAGQTMFTQDLEQRDYQREFYSDYSRWSLGAFVGPSVVWGDMKSFSHDKNYIGLTSGLNVQYQVNPTFGLKLTTGYTYNKAGAKEKLKDYMVGTDGYVEFGSKIPADAMRMGDLYSRINGVNIGLNTEIELRNLFVGNDGSKDRKWSYILSPGISVQYYRPALFTQEGKHRYSYNRAFYDWAFAIGGDAGARYKINKKFDVEARVGAYWVSNNKFDGVESATERRLNGIGYLQFGARYKFNCKGQKDNLAYAPTRRYVRKHFDTPVREIIRTEVKTVTVPVEKIVEVEKAAEHLPNLPTVNFKRGSAVIDEHLYAEELFEILSVLKKYPDAEFEIWGYADHTGSEPFNDKISMQRAEALETYLINHGVDSSRITRLRAMGKDVNLEGEASLSVAARRAVVMD